MANASELITDNNAVVGETLIPLGARRILHRQPGIYNFTFGDGGDAVTYTYASREVQRLITQAEYPEFFDKLINELDLGLSVTYDYDELHTAHQASLERPSSLSVSAMAMDDEGNFVVIENEFTDINDAYEEPRQFAAVTNKDSGDYGGRFLLFDPPTRLGCPVYFKGENYIPITSPLAGTNSQIYIVPKGGLTGVTEDLSFQLAHSKYDGRPRPNVHAASDITCLWHDKANDILISMVAHPNNRSKGVELKYSEDGRNWVDFYSPSTPGFRSNQYILGACTDKNGVTHVMIGDDREDEDATILVIYILPSSIGGSMQWSTAFDTGMRHFFNVSGQFNISTNIVGRPFEDTNGNIIWPLAVQYAEATDASASLASSDLDKHRYGLIRTSIGATGSPRRLYKAYADWETRVNGGFNISEIALGVLTGGRGMVYVPEHYILNSRSRFGATIVDTVDMAGYWTGLGWGRLMLNMDESDYSMTQTAGDPRGHPDDTAALTQMFRWDDPDIESVRQTSSYGHVLSTDAYLAARSIRAYVDGDATPHYTVILTNTQLVDNSNTVDEVTLPPLVYTPETISGHFFTRIK